GAGEIAGGKSGGANQRAGRQRATLGAERALEQPQRERRRAGVEHELGADAIARRTGLRRQRQLQARRVRIVERAQRAQARRELLDLGIGEVFRAQQLEAVLVALGVTARSRILETGLDRGDGQRRALARGQVLVVRALLEQRQRLLALARRDQEA